MTWLLALGVLASTGPVQSALPGVQDFHWKGRIPVGKAIEIVGVNGDVEATGSPGVEVEVTAVKRGRRSDPEDVTIEVVEHDDGVTICAVYPSWRRGRPNECRPGGKRHMDTHDNDVHVRFTVRVPAGVRFVGRTVNGDVDARQLGAAAEAYTVNGSITLETRSYGSATTVNGSIDARLGDAAWSGEVEFETVNGSIVLVLPANASADVRASTVNGDITTDFPLTIRGRFGPRRLTGTIGDGGRNLSLQTVNGDMEIRKRG